MKLSITQIILGLIIVLAAGYVLWWMASGVNALLDDKVLNESGVLVQNYTPENERLFAASRYASGLVLAFGLVVIITAALWKKSANKKALAAAQILSGTLIVAFSSLILLWGYSFDYIVAIEGGPVLDMGRAQLFTVLTDVSGLIVLVLGVVQLGKREQ